mmetsp:Transcript_12362/g.23270  ORF Transcript_12362/g.23270 Transcript_12362/m.23270 type:complete len:134 (+) Transcript_12362:85-486(+)
MSAKEERGMKALQRAQDDQLPEIIRELERGRKRGHWIWYVFPTSMPGMADPRDTFVTASTCKGLFEDEGRAANWQKAMELVCDQVEKDGMVALPRVDWGRIHYFLKEWKELDHKSDWMTTCLERLDKYDWPSR